MGGHQQHAEDGESESTHDPEDFGPITRRQAENIADFADKRRESKQYEKLGRALEKKMVVLAGAALVALWYFLSDHFKAIVRALLS